MYFNLTNGHPRIGKAPLNSFFKNKRVKSKPLFRYSNYQTPILEDSSGQTFIYLVSCLYINLTNGNPRIGKAPLSSFFKNKWIKSGPLFQYANYQKPILEDLSSQTFN